MSCRSFDIDIPVQTAATEPTYFRTCMRACDNKIQLRADSQDPNDPFSPWINGLQVQVLIESTKDNVYPPRLGTPVNMPNFFSNNQDVCVECPDDCNYYVFRVTQDPGSTIDPHLRLTICENTCDPGSNEKTCC